MNLDNILRLPLNKSAKIIHGDALEVNWEDVVAKTLTYWKSTFIGSNI
jgi:hypothetical protein